MALDVTSSHIAYRNPFLAVREDVFTRPDGSQGLYGVVERPDYALVIPWDGERLWLAGQWGHPAAAWSVEPPPGAGLGCPPHGPGRHLLAHRLPQPLPGRPGGRLHPPGRLAGALRRGGAPRLRPRDPVGRRAPVARGAVAPPRGGVVARAAPGRGPRLPSSWPWTSPPRTSPTATPSWPSGRTSSPARTARRGSTAWWSAPTTPS